MTEQRISDTGARNVPPALHRSRRAGWLTGGIAALGIGLAAVGGWRTADVGAAPAQGVAVATAPAALQPPATSYAGVVEKVAPAVVTIRVERRPERVPTGLDQDLGDLFGRRFGLQPRPRGRERGLGSGVVVRADGYVLTNNHVVDGAETVRVEMQDRRVLDGTVVGTDPSSDLAVVKVSASDLAVLPLGDSDRVRVGDVVLALGNPLGVGQTVTMGIVSGKGRRTGADDSYEDFLQTDAAINQGNSGGALVNLNGELVGINSQILTPTGGNIGVGFAIPANMARNVMEQLITSGRVHRARLGVTAQSVTADLAETLSLPSVRGALVSGVEAGSPADRAGIRQGDVILAVNGREVGDSNVLRNTVASLKPGSTATVTLLRDGRETTVTATVAERPADRAEGNRSEDAAPASGKFGMQVQPFTPDLAGELDVPRTTKGVVVVAVDPSGIAASSGLQEGDVIVRVGKTDVASVEELRSALDAHGARPALVLVNRQGTTLFFTLRG
jgi:Do/DeqQ family serine protease